MLTKILADAMYDIPKQKDITKITINGDMKCVYDRKEPQQEEQENALN